MELKMSAARYYKNDKNRLGDLMATSHSKATIALIIGIAMNIALAACGKSDQASNQPLLEWRFRSA